MKQSILITGAAKGIGEATARLFVSKGWNVALADIDAEAGQALTDELGPQAIFIEADTRDAQTMESVARTASDTFGGLGSVFANAGIHRRNTILDISEEEFDLVVKTNIYGTFHTLKAAIPHIMASGGGSAVICASDQSFIGKRGNFAYGLTKGALGQMTKNLAADLAQHNIRVNAVCPGTVDTPLVDSLFERVAARTGESVEDLWAEENALFARGSAGKPEEIAELVYFLASDKASFCTGGLYLADGGLVAWR